MPRLIKKGVQLRGLVIYCPKLEKEVKISTEQFAMMGWDHGGDYYDSGVSIDIMCECGSRHEINWS